LSEELKFDDEILGLRPCPFGRAVELDPDPDAEPVELGSFDSLEDGPEPLGFLAIPDPDPDPDADPDPGDGRTGLLTVTFETIGPEPGFLGLSPKKPSMVKERSGAAVR
jgi:hypothetical protein